MLRSEREPQISTLLNGRYLFAETESNLRSVESIRDLVASSDFAYILPHPRPDEDAMGASLTLSRLFQKMNPRIRSTIILPTEPKCNVDFLLHDGDMLLTLGEIPREDTSKGFIAMVDIGESDRVDNELFRLGELPLINIDHHIGTPGSRHANRLVANLQHPEFVSTTEALFWLAKQVGIQVDSQLANPMLFGLLRDTEYFADIDLPSRVDLLRYVLKERGANETEIILNTIRSVHLDDIVSIGKMLSKTVKEKNVAYVAVPFEEYKELAESGREPNTKAVVENLRNLEGVDVVFIIYERNSGTGRCSIRSRNGKINLDEVARLFGGGGHETAAAFDFQGDFQGTLMSLKQVLGSFA